MGKRDGGKLERIPIRDSRECREDNNVRGVRFVPAADLLFYPVKRCHPGPGKNLPVPPPSKGTTSVDLLLRACDTRIYHQVDQPVGAALLWHKACHFRPERRRARPISIDLSIFHGNSFRRKWTINRSISHRLSKSYYLTNLILLIVYFHYTL